METSVRVKSDLNFEIFKRFKEEKFFDSPPVPDTKKVEIVSFENFSRLLAPHLDEFSAASKQSAACPDADFLPYCSGIDRRTNGNSLLERRRIEAQFAKAIFDVLSEETGRERAVEILSQAVIRLATKSGAGFRRPGMSTSRREAEPNPPISWPMRTYWPCG